MRIEHRKIKITIEHSCAFCNERIVGGSVAMNARVAGEWVFYHLSCYDKFLERKYRPEGKETK